MRKPGNTRGAIAMATAAIAAAVMIVTGTGTGTASASASSAAAADPTNTFTIAFQANTTNLWESGGTAPGSINTGLGMARGTSPSTALGGCTGSGGETAFQANTTDLWVTGNGHNVNTGLGMARGTNPSISSVCQGRDTSVYWTAFQANTTDLWVTGNGHNVDTHLGMMPGTSPSIVAHLDSNGYPEYDVAFQANTGDLWRYNSETGLGTDLHLGMKAGTSPSISSTGGPGVEIAFQANTGDLWVTPGTTAGTDLHLGMKAGTSPSITRNYNNSSHFGIAFQANTGDLWVTPGTTAGTDLHLGMKAGTSPSYTVSGTGVPEIAFQANTGDLWVTPDKPAGGVSTGLGMARGTSPSIMAQSFTPSDGGTTYSTSGEPTVGKLYYHLGPQHWNCTGTVIGRDIVATAGHCIYNSTRHAFGGPPGIWRNAPTPDKFVPNDNSTGTHAAWSVWGIAFVTKHWHHDHAPDADFGIYVIKPRSDGAHIGDVVGTHKWTTLPGVNVASIPTHTIGYPQDFEDPRACDAPATRFNGDNSQLELNCTFADGGSGGPLTDRSTGAAYASIGGFQQGGVSSFPSYAVVWNSAFKSLVTYLEGGPAGVGSAAPVPVIASMH
jgi:V8-like Glu-specific endopeptidase